MTYNGLSKDRCHELLSSLLNCLYANFRACASPKDYLERADGKNQQSEDSIGKKIVLIGASNLGHSVSHFAGSNMEFTNVIKPGWVATVEKVSELVRTVKKLAPEAAQSVSNSSMEPHPCRFIATGNIT